MRVLERPARTSVDSPVSAASDPAALRAPEPGTSHEARATECRLTRYDIAAIACAALAIAIAVLALAGWARGLYFLASYSQDFIPIAPSSALAVILLGVCLILGVHRRGSRYGHVIAVVVVSVTALKLIEFAFGAPRSIEAYIVREPGQFGSVPTGRMSPITTLCLISVALGYCSSSRVRGATLSRWSGLLALTVLCASVVMLTGYAYGSPLLYGGRVIPASLPSGVSMLCLSTGLIALNGPSEFPLRAFSGPSARALLLRTFVPLTAGAVVLFGFLMHLTRGQDNEALVSGLIACGAVLFSVELASYTARSIGERIDHAEALHTAAVEKLREARDDLEIRVEERTDELQTTNRRLTAQVAERAKAESELARARTAELEIGARIQRLLLTGDPINVPGIRLAAFSAPSFGLNGDFMDFNEPADGVLDIIIGDVMGKGINAALVGAGIRNAIAREFGHIMKAGEAPAPERIVERIRDRTIEQLISLDMFVTLCYARVEIAQRRVSIVNAGHTRTIHVNSEDGRPQLLGSDNLPLGVWAGDSYSAMVVPYRPHDRFVFYSDAVTEAKSPSGEMFGSHRLLDGIQPDDDPEMTIRRIRQAVLEFTTSDTFADDFTCIAVQMEDC